MRGKNGAVLIIIAFLILTANASFAIESCDPIAIEGEVQFCLDKSLISEYKIKHLDSRKNTIEIDQYDVLIETKDYKASGRITPGITNWKEHKVDSGIKISFTVDFIPRYKNFDELVAMYSVPAYEPHNEVPPRKGGQVNQVNGLKYISEFRFNDPDSYSKGFEVSTHFFNNGKEYSLYIYASPESISKDNFMLLHDTILKTLKFS